MRFETHFLEHQDVILSYIKAGHGSQVMLAFHGFGQDHSIFAKHIHLLDAQFTIYAFDLFFHGQSQWPELDTPLSKKFWSCLLNILIEKHKLLRFSLMGYSLGAKFVLATLEAVPKRVLAVYFIAPDGIQTNFWYKLATYPVAVRKLFKGLIDNPGLFQMLTSCAIWLKILDKTVARFALSQMDTTEKRRRVYYSWIVFRHLKFDMKIIAYLINAGNIKITMIVGQYDKVITLKNTQKLLDKLKNYHLEILKTGHNGMMDESLSLWDKIK